MSNSTWVLLQIWVTGCVGGLMWLLVARINETWERHTQQRRNRREGHRPTRPTRSPGTASLPAEDRSMVRADLLRKATCEREASSFALDIPSTGTNS